MDLQLVEEGEDESPKESDEENAIGTIAVRTSTAIYKNFINQIVIFITGRE